MSKLVCDIVTPVEKLHSEEAYLVVVPGIEGEMGFLEDHEQLVSVLADGLTRIQPEKDGDIIRYVIQGGYVQVTGKKVIILADRACPFEEVDGSAARTQLEDFENQLANLSEEEAKISPLKADIAWCKAQIKASEN